MRNKAQAREHYPVRHTARGVSNPIRGGNYFMRSRS